MANGKFFMLKVFAVVPECISEFLLK
jgi:hypothetical protein